MGLLVDILEPGIAQETCQHNHGSYIASLREECSLCHARGFSSQGGDLLQCSAIGNAEVIDIRQAQNPTRAQHSLTFLDHCRPVARRKYADEKTHIDHVE